MTKFASEDVSHFLIGGYNVLGNSTILSITKEAIVKDTTGFGTAWETMAATGLKKGALTQGGFFDDAVGDTHEMMKAGNGVSRVAMFSLKPSALAVAFTGFAGALQMKYDRKAGQGEFHQASASYEVNGAIEEGKLAKVLSTVVADGNSQAGSIDDAALSSAGGAGYLEVSNLVLDTATNLVVKLRHSTDNVNFTDLGTFTAKTLFGAERITFAGTVNRYIAASWAWTGGAGAASSATLAIGYVRN